jgi:hypothetical protein
MPWPPKIATAKPHERPKPFDSWYFQARAKTVADMPMMTEILYRVCKGDEKLFEEVNGYLEDAFNAGVEHGKK